MTLDSYLLETESSSYVTIFNESPAKFDFEKYLNHYKDTYGEAFSSKEN
jgi:hypothetical protein